MDFLHKLNNPEGLKQLIEWGSYVFLFAILFAETGLLIGFFLPGDSLLFVAGTLCSIPLRPGTPPTLSLPLLIVLGCVAAIAGDSVGYLIGRRLGPALLSRPDSKLFKRAHIEKTQAFYDKHGPKTIVLARFVPIVRTFAPTVAGVAAMKYRDFLLFNVLGGVGWISAMSLLGFFLGKNAWIQHNLEKAVILIVLLSVLPMIVHYFQERRHQGSRAGAPDSVAPDSVAPRASRDV